MENLEHYLQRVDLIAVSPRFVEVEDAKHIIGVLFGDASFKIHQLERALKTVQDDLNAANYRFQQFAKGFNFSAGTNNSANG